MPARTFDDLQKRIDDWTWIHLCKYSREGTEE